MDGTPWGQSKRPGEEPRVAATLATMSDIPAQVSDLMDPTQWRSIDGFPDEDVTYHRWVERDGTAERDLPAVRIAVNRPEVRNAFRPQTVDQLYRALDHARMTDDVGTIILTLSLIHISEPTRLRRIS